MKRLIIIVLAVLMLGLAVPNQSEAGGEWMPAAIVGGIILGAVIAETTQPHQVYAYAAPGPGYVYYSPRPVYVYPRHVNPPRYRYVPKSKPHYRGDQRHSNRNNRRNSHTHHQQHDYRHR